MRRITVALFRMEIRLGDTLERPADLADALRGVATKLERAGTLMTGPAIDLDPFDSQGAIPDHNGDPVGQWKILTGRKRAS